MSLFLKISKILYKKFEFKKDFNDLENIVLTPSEFFKYYFITKLHFNFYQDQSRTRTCMTNMYLRFGILQGLINNKFIPDEVKNDLLSFFSDCQKVFLTLSRFVYLCKLKKAIIYDFDTDLYSNPLNTIKSYNKLELYDIQSNTIYTFRLSDLINIINRSLSNSPYFFSSPLKIKNPFTNVPFNHSNLYNIYFKIKNSQLEMPILFYLYYKSWFNLDIFSEKYQSYIRDEYIKFYSKSVEPDEKFELLRSMIHEFNDTVYISFNFPQTTLIDAFGKIFYLYLIYSYSLLRNHRIYAKEIIVDFIDCVFAYSPLFGKKKYFKYELWKINKLDQLNVKYFIFSQKRNIYYYFIDHRNIIL